MTARTGKRTWKVAAGREVVPGRRVIERLGGGGRTEVYRCTDEATGAPVAVKILRPGRTGEKDVRMLRREARSLGAVDHPGFPRLLDVGLDQHPAWIVMSQVDGPHLSALVRDYGPIEVEQAIPLARDVADALAHLHESGRVHLDVKPSNIVMGTRPVLLDLGASRTIERAARLSANIGTLTWLSPEQAGPGPAGVPSPPSDVWGLGISLLYALTGDNPLAVRRDEADVEPGALAAACRAAARQLPSALRGVVVACLATDPRDRPTARELTDISETGAPTSTGIVRRFSAMLRGPRPGERDL